MRNIISDFDFYAKDLNKLNSELFAISDNILSCMIYAGKLKVMSSSELLPSEIEQIQSKLSSFQDTDIDLKVPKILTLVANSNGRHFHDIDYNIEVNLFPKRTVVKGEVSRVDWYSDEDLTNIILRVDINYTRDASGFALYREVTRTWYNLDGTENEDKKHTKKIYSHNHTDQIDEGIKRRRLLVNSLQGPCLSMMMQVLLPMGYSESAVLLKARNFLDQYDSDFSKFINNSSTITDPASPDYGKKSVIIKLSDTTTSGPNGPHHEWLDMAPPLLGGTKTIRQYLVGEFSI